MLLTHWNSHASSRWKLRCVEVATISSARARVEAGARSRDLNRAAGTHGLGAVLGCHPDVGVAGLLRWLASAAGAGGENGLARTQRARSMRTDQVSGIRTVAFGANALRAWALY